MIQHTFKLICTQWKNNVWILLELFIVAVLMWYIIDYFTVMFINSRTPVGFDIEDTYVVNLANYQKESPHHIMYEEGSDEPALDFLRIVDRIRSHPGVEAVSLGQWHYPYCSSNRSMQYQYDSLKTNVQVLYVTPAYFDVFQVHPAGGGSPSLLGRALENGTIISSTVADRLFPGVPAVGQTIREDSTSSFRVSAVATPLKMYLYTTPGRYAYFPFREQMLMGKDEAYLRRYTDIAFKTRPGLNAKDFAASFKKEMSTPLSIGNFYLLGVTPISDYRDFMLKAYGVNESVQNRTGFTIFFLFNVFLGVIGTFWLRIKRRRGEIGLRLAVGSSRAGVMRQMMTESLLLAGMAVVPAVLVWIHLTWMDFMPTQDLAYTWQRFMVNTLFTLIPLLAVILLATWYPARKSSLIQPAEALHYE